MIGMKTRLARWPAIAVAATMAYATPASAQATRTWVSGVGDDVNPCSRTAPCKTFAGAISKTAAGGEINCLDPGGFGAVTIIKSMTISCHYTEGGALAGGNGIVVNMPATTDVTFIRGLDIFGVNPPTNGIRFINNGSLHVEDTRDSPLQCRQQRRHLFPAVTGGAELYITNLDRRRERQRRHRRRHRDRAAGVGGSVKGVHHQHQGAQHANNGMRLDSTNGPITAVIHEQRHFRQRDGHLAAGAGQRHPTHAHRQHRLQQQHGRYRQRSGATLRIGNTTITGNTLGVNRLTAARAPDRRQ